VTHIRPARPADAAAIAVVHVRSWQAAYQGMIPQGHLDALDPAQRQPVWDRLLARTSWPRQGILVAEIDGHLTGFAKLCPTRDPGQDPATVGELAAIYVTPEAWGAGTGRQLMAAAVETLARAGYEQATLWVLDTNERAQRFYEATGWRRDGAVKQDEIQNFPLTEIRYRYLLG
jgi:GNAT superfamily N-acetyltransferase